MAWRRMRSGHCSSEMLLAYVDGELSRRTAKKVQLHLESCWECRARLTDLDNQAQEIARRSAQQTFPSPARIATARSDFFARVSECEQTSVELSAEFRSVRPFRTPAIWTVAGTVVLCAITIGLWLTNHQPKPKPNDVLVAANESERSFYQRGLSVYQAFQVQIEANQPQPFTRTSRLEVWSEGQGHRFALRWKDTQGLLKLGSWRTHGQRLYVYDSDLSKEVRLEENTPHESFSLADFSEYGASAAELERGFMRWIRSRSWKPLSLSQEMLLFCSEEGVLLRAERVLSDPRGQILRLSAKRIASGRRVELVLELDPVTYRPQLTKVRLQAGRRVAELRVIVARAEYVKASRAVFEPDFPLRTPGWKDAPPSSAGEARPKLPTRLLGPDLTGLETTEAKVRYILHQLAACLGEPVEIVRQPSAIYVRGVMKTTARKQELLSHLAEFHDLPTVKIDIRTDEELREEKSRRVTSTGSSGPTAAWEKAQPLKRSVTNVTVTELSIQRDLENYLESQSASSPSPMGESGKTRGGSRVTQFFNDSLSLWRSAFKHSWALRRLLERYANTQVRNLQPGSRRMLELMVRDHIVNVEQHTEQVRSLVQPVLSAIAKSASKRGASILRPLEEARPQDRTDPGWIAVGLRLFARTDRIDRLIHALLAGDVLPVRTDVDNTPTVREHGIRPNEAIRDLLAEFRQLEVEFSDFETQVAKEFSVKPTVASSNWHE